VQELELRTCKRGVFTDGASKCCVD